MAPPPPPPPPAASLKAAVNAKRYTLAALLATLVLAATITISFVLLCPAHITFSVAHTGSSSSSTSSSGTAGGSSSLDLTLAADNPSRRAKVTYVSMFVDVSNSTAAGAAQRDNWVRATVKTPMPLRQTGRTAAIDVTVPLVDAPWTQDFTGNRTSRFSVMVTAQARFRVGVAWTRLYDIKVSCSPVSFFPAKARPAGGAAAAASGAAGLPVRCV